MTTESSSLLCRISAGAALHANTESRKTRPGVFHRPDQQRSYSPGLYETPPGASPPGTAVNVDELSLVQPFHVAAFIKDLEPVAFSWSQSV
jgi:hypothetical protein